MVGGYLAANPARKAAAAQQQYQRAEKTNEDRRAEQELALKVQEQSRLNTQSDEDRARNAARDGALANITKELPQPTTDPLKDPGTWQRYYLQLGQKLRASALPEDAAKAEAVVPMLGRALQSTTAAAVNTATVPLRGAQTNQANANAKDIGTRHEDRVLSLQDRLAIAQAAAQTSLIRAQIAASASDRRASEATARAQEAQANMLTREIMREHEEDARQNRGFQHADKVLSAKETAKKNSPAGTATAQIMALQKNPKWGSIPSYTQTAIVKQLKEGASIEGMRAQVKANTKLDPATKQATLELLGEPPPPPAPAATPGPNPIQQFFSQFHLPGAHVNSGP